MPPAAPVKLPRNLKTPIHIHVSNGHFTYHLPGSVEVERFHILRVTFKAPVAITDADSSYVLEARAVGCDSGASSQQTREDIHKGQQVTLELEQLPTHAGLGSTGPHCGGYIRGRVGLAIPTGNAARTLTAPTETTEPTKGEIIKRFYIDTRQH